MFIIGKVHDTPEEWKPGGLRGPDTYSDEAETFFESFRGKPVCINHDEGLRVGTVERVWPSSMFGGCYMATLMVDDKLDIMQPIIEKMQLGEYNGLSLSQMVRMEEGTGVRRSPGVGVEISLVEEGAVNNSRILFFGNRDHVYLSQSGLDRIKMDSSATKSGQVEESKGEKEPTPAQIDMWRKSHQKLEEQLLQTMADNIKSVVENPPEDQEEGITALKGGDLAPLMVISASYAREKGRKDLEFKATQELLSAKDKELEELKAELVRVKGSGEEMSASLPSKRVRVFEGEKNSGGGGMQEALREQLKKSFFPEKPSVATGTPAFQFDLEDPHKKNQLLSLLREGL